MITGASLYMPGALYVTQPAGPKRRRKLEALISNRENYQLASLLLSMIPELCVTVMCTLRIITRLLKVIWKQATSPSLVADPLTATMHSCSTVLARWCHCGCPSNKQFLRHTPYSPYMSHCACLFPSKICSLLWGICTAI